MGEFKLLNVGIIRGSHLEEYYRVMMESNGSTYQLELNFQNKSIEMSKRGILKDFMYNLEHFEKRNIRILKEDSLADGPVHSYIDFHLEQLGRYKLLKHFNIAPMVTDAHTSLCSQLQLIRIALYPDGKYNTTYYATFDYILSDDMRNEILSIKTDELGEVQYITWER